MQRALQVLSPFYKGLKEPDDDHQLYAQKITVSGDAVLYAVGPLNGSVDSLLAILSSMASVGAVLQDDFTLKPSVDGKIPYLILLGSYGNNIELLYILAVLMEKNPGRVVVLRGPHDVGLKDITEPTALSKHFYRRLPVTAYIGFPHNDTIRYIQAVSVGLDLYDPTDLFSEKEACSILPITSLRGKSIRAALQDIVNDQQYAVRGTLSGAASGWESYCEQQTPRLETVGFLWNECKLIPGSGRRVTELYPTAFLSGKQELL